MQYDLLDKEQGLTFVGSFVGSFEGCRVGLGVVGPSLVADGAEVVVVIVSSVWEASSSHQSRSWSGADIVEVDICSTVPLEKNALVVPDSRDDFVKQPFVS